MDDHGCTTCLLCNYGLVIISWTSVDSQQQDMAGKSPTFYGLENLGDWLHVDYSL
jgi:hypothetical protein